MVRLREEFEGDKENPSSVSDYRTPGTQFEVICENCGNTFFGDEAMQEEWSKAAEHDHLKTFICTECASDQEDAAFA